MSLKLEVGKTYRNGFGATFTIRKAPDDTCCWFESDGMQHWHETGELAGVGFNPRVNLIEEVT